jgi:hypothetical protein
VVLGPLGGVVVTAAEEWSTPEVVRAINRLSTALERFEEGVEETFSGLDQKYVPREVHAAEIRLLEGRLDQIERERESSRSWVRELVAPTVSALLVGVALLAAGLFVR